MGIGEGGGGGNGVFCKKINNSLTFIKEKVIQAGDEKKQFASIHTLVKLCRIASQNSLNAQFICIFKKQKKIKYKNYSPPPRQVSMGHP